MISGIFRSGTTIIGKATGSFKNVEYSFEPPLAFHLDYLLQNNLIKEKVASDLLQTYFAEDVVFNFHHGRNYNFRERDASYIFNMKPRNEIEARWQKVKGVSDAIKLMRELGSRLVFKVPATYSLIPPLLDNFDGFKVIEVQRNLKSIWNSVMAKGWFMDTTLSEEGDVASWPLMDTPEARNVPYYFKGNVKEWNSWNPETRCMQIINSLVERRLEMQKFIEKKFPKNYLVLRYEDLLDSPYEEIKKIADFAGMEFTSKTTEIINTIKPTVRQYPDAMIETCSPSIKNSFLQYNKMLGYRDEES